MRVRLKDIAEDLGLSVITVSKALRDHSDISEQTRRRVLVRSRELGYRPNLAARALVTGSSHLIGLVVPDLVHPFFGEVAKGISRELRSKGYSLIISSSEEDAELEREELERMLARGVDGLVLASTQSTAEGFRRIELQDTPYLLVDRRFAEITAPFVGIADEAAGRMAVRHLIEQGCRRIAHIRGGEMSTGRGRAAGYRQALNEAGIDLGSEYIIAGNGSDDLGDLAGYRAMQQLLKIEPRPDAVFCFNDPVALGAMKALHEAGVAIPDEIAIVGCGNVTYADALRVPLSSVDQQSHSLGSLAAQQMLKLIETKEPLSQPEILLEPKLIIRASSRKLPE